MLSQWTQSLQFQLDWLSRKPFGSTCIPAPCPVRRVQEHAVLADLPVGAGDLSSQCLHSKCLAHGTIAPAHSAGIFKAVYSGINGLGTHSNHLVTTHWLSVAQGEDLGYLPHSSDGSVLSISSSPPPSLCLSLCPSFSFSPFLPLPSPAHQKLQHESLRTWFPAFTKVNAKLWSMDTWVTIAPQAYFPSSRRFCSHKLIVISLSSFLGFLLSFIPKLHSRPADLLWYKSVCMHAYVQQAQNRYQQFIVSFSPGAMWPVLAFELL